VMADGGKKGRIPALWDGRAAERIVDCIVSVLQPSLGTE
jgi:hypothetical protein